MSPDAAPESSTQTRSRAKVTLTKDRLKAMVVISKPEAGEPGVTVQEVNSALAGAGVVFGIDSEAIGEALTKGKYGTLFEAAAGTPMTKGKDSEFEYLFDTQRDLTPEEGDDGRIDYRNMNYTQNVSEDQVLVRMTPPTDGESGIGVDGKEVAAPRGRQLPFKYGENVRVSEDGFELVAGVNGAIVFVNGSVAVKDVLVISGDVDMSVGNIDCLGSVRVSGIICAGFTVKVGGNLEVGGNVQDAIIDVRGNVIVRGGFFGNGEGIMNAAGDIVVKYAEGQRISSGNDIVSGGELLNCQVTAKRNVIVKGKRGKIVGGEVNAGREIRASFIGSDAGTATVLTVAFDADLMRQYHEATTEMERLYADEKRVKESLYSLYKLQMDGKLNKQQEKALAQLEAFQKTVPEGVKVQEKVKAEITTKLLKLKEAKIIAEQAMYPGVDARVGILRKEIEQEAREVKLTSDGSRIHMSKYDPQADIAPES